MPTADEKRISIEKRITRRVVREAIKAGYVISVDDGGERFAVDKSQSGPEIRAALHNTDEDTVFLQKPDAATPSGWIKFVYGNDGGHYVISDYSTTLSDFMEPIDNWIEGLPGYE